MELLQLLAGHGGDRFRQLLDPRRGHGDRVDQLGVADRAFALLRYIYRPSGTAAVLPLASHSSEVVRWQLPGRRWPHAAAHFPPQADGSFLSVPRSIALERASRQLLTIRREKGRGGVRSCCAHAQPGGQGARWPMFRWSYLIPVPQGGERRACALPCEPARHAWSAALSGTDLKMVRQAGTGCATARREGYPGQRACARSIAKDDVGRWISRSWPMVPL